MKPSIGRKLVLSYLLLIVITLTVSGALFVAMIRQYMVEQAKSGLHTEATHLISVLGTEDNSDIGLLKRQILTRLALGMVESDYFVVDRRTNRVMTSSSEKIPVGIRPPVNLQAVFLGNGISGEGQIQNKEIVFVALPNVNTRTNQIAQALVLYTELEQVHNVTRSVVNVLVRGFLITVGIMIVLALLMMRTILRPLRSLREAVGRLTRRDFKPPDVIRTGDEFEELSTAFRQMTVELHRYDEGQRRFLQNASHELKTPLMAIQGYAEGIRDGIFKGEEADRVLDVISNESIRLKKMVDELIYLSKLETLEDMYQPKQIDLKPLVQESMVRVESLALQKGVRLTLQGEVRSRLQVDPDKLMQALINLVANGIRHAEQSVQVSLQENTDGILLTIEDDGNGFRAEDKDRIFERFFRGAKGDTGLGLAITRAIIEKSGGTITADNRPDKGAIFAIQFPASQLANRP